MLNSCTLCKFVCHYVYVSLAICETVKTLKEPLHLRNSSICTVNAGRFSSVNVIFINFKHFVSNATWSFQKLIIHFIAQINALNSECEGDKHFRIFLAPIKPSKSPCLYTILDPQTSQNLSMNHQFFTNEVKLNTVVQ